jgi:serine/threonine protein kinase
MHIDAGQLGKYELRERLGQGGMAEVWKAFDARLQRFVAIKFLHSTLRGDPTFISRFSREAQAVASLHHPNIVQIYDFETPNPGEEDALAYMVMDYIEGQTLAEFLRDTSHAGQFLPDADLFSLFYSISDAIDYAHRRGLLHRDIKPANILLDQRNTARNPMGEPILTDFGIVKIMGSAAGTLTSSSMGTPLYISPEQAQGHPDTAASDIYSLGVVLYEACTGRPPFRGDSPFAILQQHLTTPPPPPEQFNPAISPALSEVIIRSLAKKPEERYPSAMALMAALAVALNLTLPDRRNVPISSPDIRLLAGEDDLATQFASRSGVPVPTTPPAPARAQPLTPAPDAYAATPVDEAPTVIPGDEAGPTEFAPPTPVPANSSPTQRAQAAPSIFTQAPQSLPPEVQPRNNGRRNTWLIAVSVVLLLILAGSGLAIFHALQNNTPTAAVVGQAFFLSTGNGVGANNQGLNDSFQVNLHGLATPALGKQYYAWLLPDLAQSESSARALGVLHVSGGSAALSYTDPQHNNLVGQFSRFLVTEEPASPAPISPSLDQTTWRYYGEIPQGTPVKDCSGVALNQLSVLCHLRHLLSGDPDLAKVHLQGGLNFWLSNNVTELQKWAREAVDHTGASDVRHKLVNILYILNGPQCIQQSLQKAAPGPDNVVDDQTLPTIAAIPLMDCSLTPDLPGYVTHIDNHLNAMLQSPGVSSNQKALALQINPELNTIAGWLKTIDTDAQQLVAMDDTQLVSPTAVSLRNALSDQATEVLSGGINSSTGNSQAGVQAVVSQIQGLAKINVTVYQSH